MALNKILPKFLSLKRTTALNAEKLKRTFRENLIHFLDACYDIGIWHYILENRYVDKIAIEGRKAKPFYDRDEASHFQEYVDKVAVNEEHVNWLHWFYGKLGENYEIMKLLNENLEHEHGFRLDDLRNASLYLESLTKNNKIMIPKNEVHTVFSKNIPSEVKE